MTNPKVVPKQLKKQDKWKKDLANKLMPRMHGKPQKIVEALRVFEEVDDLSGNISQATTYWPRCGCRDLTFTAMRASRQASAQDCNRWG